MLTSISPLGERSRGMRWQVTFLFFVIGAMSGGVVTGVVTGESGKALHLTYSSTTIAFISAGTITVLLTLAEWTRWRRWVAGIRRQVNEDWLTSYRGWVYGIGFGFQLGLGFVTIANAALFCLLAAAVLFQNVSVSILGFCIYGALRGLPLLVAVRATSPAGVLAIDQGMDRYAATAQEGGRFAQLALGIAAVSLGLWA